MDPIFKFAYRENIKLDFNEKIKLENAIDRTMKKWMEYKKENMEVEYLKTKIIIDCYDWIEYCVHRTLNGKCGYYE